jgi:glutamate---cysteine ligase / carboxylate-amine ligase
VRRLCRDADLNRHMTAAGRAIVEENKWRAERYGIHGSLIDLDSGEARPVPELADALLDLVREDGEALGCRTELAHVRTILQRGTSADQQLAVFREHVSQGEPPPVAIVAVVDWLAGATASATDMQAPAAL